MNSENVRVRFAPSPTGYLHIGNARTALFNWLFARKHKGTFILRIEDTDVERSSEKYMQSMIDDLNWLGLDWDEGPDKGGEYGPYRQSLRSAIYAEYFEKLKKGKHVYPCYCSQDELEKRRCVAIEKGEPPRYDNRCRDLTEDAIKKFQNEGRMPTWRFKVSGEKVVVSDLLRGDVTFDTSLMGDFIILKQDGNPTFNFAVCVDDVCMRITHIIRGEDHLSNTPRHILLWKALGAKIPVFVHCPLIMGPDGERLSKRHGAVSVTEYNRLGYLPEGLLNYLALLGWSSDNAKELFNMEELIEAFNLEGLSKSAALFNKEKLDWVNSYHIRSIDSVKLTEMCIPFLKKAKLIKGSISERKFSLLCKMISAVKGNLVTLADSAEYMKIFLRETVEITNPDEKKILEAEHVGKLVETLEKLLSETKEITLESMKQVFSDAQKIVGVKGKDFYMPLRIIITGSTKGPELADVLPLLGKEAILKRLLSIDH